MKRDQFVLANESEYVMRITTRVKAMESKLPEPKEPRLIIVLEDADGTWHDCRGNVVDRATVGPIVRVIVLRDLPNT